MLRTLIHEPEPKDHIPTYEIPNKLVSWFNSILNSQAHEGRCHVKRENVKMHVFKNMLIIHKYPNNSLLWIAEAIPHQVVETIGHGGFGVEVVKLTSELIDIRKEVSSCVQPHVAALGCFKQCEVSSRPVKRCHSVAEAFVNVHLRREQGDIRLSTR